MKIESYHDRCAKLQMNVTSAAITIKNYLRHNYTIMN